MCQAQQALLVHLQQPLPHAQSPVTARCPRGADLHGKVRRVQRWPRPVPGAQALPSPAQWLHLRNKDALVGRVTGVAGMALGAPTDADAQLFARHLVDVELAHAGWWRVPAHQQYQLQARPEQRADCLLVRGPANVLSVHRQDAITHPQATANRQASGQHLRRPVRSA